MKPSDFRMPIRRVAAATAPLTTMPMISIDMHRPSTPKETTNGTNVAEVFSADILIFR